MDTRIGTIDVHARGETGRTSARGLYAAAGMVAVVLTAMGFQGFYRHGLEFGGVPIARPMLPYVLVHGIALTLFVTLFLAQAALIANRQRRIHMRLGWISVMLGGLIVLSGFVMVVKSIQADPQSLFFGLRNRQFLFVMLTELAAFATLLAAAVLNRRHAARHRALMLLALLSVLSGATVRIPALYVIFGSSGWIGLFGPVLTLGVLFLAVRSIATGSLDRWLAGGLASLALVLLIAVQVASSAWWSRMAQEAFGI